MLWCLFRAVVFASCTTPSLRVYGRPKPYHSVHIRCRLMHKKTAVTRLSTAVRLVLVRTCWPVGCLSLRLRVSCSRYFLARMGAHPRERRREGHVRVRVNGTCGRSSACSQFARGGIIHETTGSEFRTVPNSEPVVLWVIPPRANRGRKRGRGAA